MSSHPIRWSVALLAAATSLAIVSAAAAQSAKERRRVVPTTATRAQSAPEAFPASFPLSAEHEAVAQRVVPSYQVARTIPTPIADDSVGAMEAGCLAGDCGGCEADCRSGCFGCAGRCPRWYDNVALFAAVDSFKGPRDLDNQNGNFGTRLGLNAGFPLWRQRGIGVQVGTAETITNWHGTRYTDTSARTQNFTTVGLFQKNPDVLPRLSWGFGFDWLYDDYYTLFTMGQWRMHFAFDLNDDNQLGVVICLPHHGDVAYLGSEATGYSWNHFRPITQADLYWRHYYQSGATSSFWVGAAENPGGVVLGADAQMPISPRLALVGAFTTILPDTEGRAGQDEEMWNVSVGIRFTPSPCRNFGRPGRFAPLMPVADNGLFATRRW